MNTNTTVDTSALLYEAINTPVLDLVPASTARLLDLGCGSGILGEHLKRRLNCEITGVTYSEVEAALAREKLDHVLVCDLNNFDPSELGEFDCIICSHVLEHLYEPQELLKRSRIALSKGGVVIVALPNILYWKQRAKFLKGNFQYTDGGLMDRTHFRFFDWKTAGELLKNSGFKIQKRLSEGHVPLPGLRRVAPRLAALVDRRLSKRWPGLFSNQFILVGLRQD